MDISSKQLLAITTQVIHIRIEHNANIYQRDSQITHNKLNAHRKTWNVRPKGQGQMELME